MTPRMHALVVPAIVALGTLAYVVQTTDARSSALLVPYGLVAVVTAMLLVTVIAEMRAPSAAPGGLGALARPAALVALCVVYYVAFTGLGFGLATLLFVFAAAALMRLSWAQSAILAVATTAVLLALVTVMDFNVPSLL